jgi:hypothetical protein
VRPYVVAPTVALTVVTIRFLAAYGCETMEAREAGTSSIVDVAEAGCPQRNDESLTCQCAPRCHAWVPVPSSPQEHHQCGDGRKDAVPVGLVPTVEVELWYCVNCCFSKRVDTSGVSSRKPRQNLNRIDQRSFPADSGGIQRSWTSTSPGIRRHRVQPAQGSTAVTDPADSLLAIHTRAGRAYRCRKARTLRSRKS